MRVLVTRPEATADTTLRRLARAHHQTLLLPMSEAEHLPMPPPARHPAALVATSAEAFRALRLSSAAVRDLLALPIYCVGPATAEAARAFGFSDVRTGPGDGAGLATRAIEAFGSAPRPVLYLAGSPRMPDVEASVTAAGVPIEVALLYRMRPLIRAPGALAMAVAAFRPEAVLFYSREAARRFFAEMAPVPLSEAVRILCLGPGTAEAVPPGCGHAVIAATPDEDALLALLDA